MRTAESSLRLVKLFHTLAWAFFVACIVGIPIVAWLERYRASVVLIGIVTGESLVLAFNGWRCPLTAVAARYTDDRRDNFDIYLPLWLARYNKILFGSLFAAGIAFTLLRRFF